MKYLFCLFCFALLLGAQESLIPNGSFEEGWAGWKHEADPGMGSLSAEAAHGGEKGLLINDPSDEKGSEIFSSMIPVEAGKKYTLVFWARFVSGDGAGIFLRFWDRDRKELQQSKNFVGIKGKAWAKQAGTFTAPEGAVSADLYVRAMLKAKCVVHIDEVEILEGSMPTPPASQSATTAGAPSSSSVPEPVLLPENPAWAAQHPRLLTTREDIPALLARIKAGGEPQKAWKELLSRCDKQLASDDPFFLKRYETLKAINTKAPGGKGAYEGYFATTGSSVELLSFAYLLTKEKRYGEAAVKIMRQIAVNYPVLEFPGFFYTRGFFLRGAAITYDSCYDLMGAEERLLFRRTLATWARVFYERSPRESWENWAEDTLNQVWNWNAGISGNLGLACLAILGETDEPVRPWLFQAARQVENFWRFAIDKNGGAVEGPAYIGYGAAPTPFFIEALRRSTGEDLFETTHYRKVGGFFPNEVLPDGKRVLNLSDSGYSMAHWQVMLYALHRAADRRPLSWCYRSLAPDVSAQLSDNLVALILWWDEAPGIAAWNPGQLMENWAWSPWRGVMISRTGWKADDVLFTMHAQQYTLIRHDQVDKGQVNLFAYGEDFLIDSGYGNDGGMLMSQGAGAHNLVLIDGQGPLGSGAHAQTSGYVRDHLHTAAADFARADLKDAWEYTIQAGYQKKRVRTMKKAARHALFARGPLPYLVVYEDLAMDAKAHRYGIQWHTGARNAFHVDAQGVTIKPSLDGARYPIMAVQPYQSKLDGGVFTPNAPVSEAGEMRASATLPRDGRYQIWALATATGTDGGKSDSIFFSIDGGKAGFAGGSDAATFAWKIATEGVVWSKLVDNNGTLPVGPLTLSKGPHQFSFKTREEGAAILAFYVVPAEETRSLDRLVREKGEYVLVMAADFQVSGPVKKLPSNLPKSEAEAFLRLASPGAPAFREESFLTTQAGSHPRLTAEVDAAEPDFLWALVPYRIASGFKAAEAVKTVPLKKGVGISVALPGGMKDLACRWDGAAIQAEDFECDGHFLWFRRDGEGKPIAWTVAQGKSLKAGGKWVFQADGEEVTAAYDGARLDISARELRSFALTAECANVFVNGIPVVQGNRGPLQWKGDAEKQREIRAGWEFTLY
ncbi:MAG: carbohydrate binding domain-containing protein [Spirochaetes bacterium]|nr:carbohydrate binding domain-containing protein [Spirochaetota bacterium]